MKKLTVDECIVQFRWYAKANAEIPENSHLMIFCADFCRNSAKVPPNKPMQWTEKIMASITASSVICNMMMLMVQ